jgi:hypothetical protein
VKGCFSLVLGLAGRSLRSGLSTVLGGTPQGAVVATDNVTADAELANCAARHCGPLPRRDSEHAAHRLAHAGRGRPIAAPPCSEQAVRYRLLVGPRNRISKLSASKQLADVQSRKNRRDKRIELTVQMVGLW